MMAVKKGGGLFFTERGDIWISRKGEGGWYTFPHYEYIYRIKSSKILRLKKNVNNKRKGVSGMK